MTWGDVLNFIGDQLAAWFSAVSPYLGELLVLGAWIAWWLWGVNWNRAWGILQNGGWVPVVLLLVIAAAAWSQMAPAECTCLGFMTIPNFWWQLCSVALLFFLALCCGWLQAYFGWTPEEVELNPPAAGAAHAHH
ncbi:MAG: hypothetical protein KatS3mg105_4907 [Gemmatales bacterium]|nr:MAG: hypothetical protein KatS3mg105_4907 [Gemmatales bacterium]